MTDTLEFDEDDLAEGRRLVAALDGAQWELGDLAIKIAGPAKNTRARDGSIAKLSVFSDAIGLHYEQMNRYRSVATAWPPEQRVPGASWTLHRTLAPLPERDRFTLLVEFISACEGMNIKPTRDLLLTKLRAKPILPEQEPSVMPSMKELLADRPQARPNPPTGGTKAAEKQTLEMVNAADMVAVDAPSWVSTELTRIRMVDEVPVSIEQRMLTVDEAMAQFYELEKRVSELNEYRRCLLFAIASKQPTWWPELERKLDAMDEEEQYLVGADG